MLIRVITGHFVGVRNILPNKKVSLPERPDPVGWQAELRIANHDQFWKSAAVTGSRLRVFEQLWEPTFRSPVLTSAHRS
jgi:hypothetical protein